MAKRQGKKISVATRVWPETKAFAEKMAEKKGMSYTDYVDYILSQDLDEISKKHNKQIKEMEVKHEKEIAKLNERIDKMHDTLNETNEVASNAQKLHAEIKQEYNTYRNKQEQQLLLELEEEKNRKWWKFW